MIYMTSESTKQLTLFQDYLVAQKLKYQCKLYLNLIIILLYVFLALVYDEIIVVPFIGPKSIGIICLFWIFIALICVLFVKFLYDLKRSYFLTTLSIIGCGVIFYLISIQNYEYNLELFFMFLPFLIIWASITKISSEKSAYNKMEKYGSHCSDEMHTALIVARNANVYSDSFDYTALTLAKGLALRDLAYQFYLCTDSEMLRDILLNPNISQIWIFGHGDIGGVSITERGYLSYAEFMLEKKNGEIGLHIFPTKKAVYQCHCNGGYGWSLADFLLPRKGVLDEGVDIFLNYRETGINGNLVNFKIFGWKPFGFLQNLNTDYSNKTFITKYLEHLDRVAGKET